MSDCPPRLYKYESFSELSLRNLKAQSIYFGSPADFNDPYDCGLSPEIQPPSSAELEALLNDYLGSPHITEQGKKSLSDTSPAVLKAQIHGAVSSTIESRQSNFRDLGVSCFSEKFDNLLMWSHYGGKHRGFCLEFDTTFEPFTKARKVSYSSSMPKVSAYQLLGAENADQYLGLLTTKAESWAYELEWRAIHPVAGTLFGYHAGCLTGVYFGPNIPRESLEIICLILQGQNPGVKFWRGRRSKTEFKVEFEEVTYQSHLASKDATPRTAQEASGDAGRTGQSHERGASCRLEN